jgi:hypothetical protein
VVDLALRCCVLLFGHSDLVCSIGYIDYKTLLEEKRNVQRALSATEERLTGSLSETNAVRASLSRREEEVTALRVQVGGIQREVAANSELERMRTQVVVKGMRSDMETMRTELEWREKVLMGQIKSLRQRCAAEVVERLKMERELKDSQMQLLDNQLLLQQKQAGTRDHDAKRRRELAGLDAEISRLQRDLASGAHASVNASNGSSGRNDMGSADDFMLPPLQALPPLPDFTVHAQRANALLSDPLFAGMMAPPGGSISAPLSSMFAAAGGMMNGLPPPLTHMNGGYGPLFPPVMGASPPQPGAPLSPSQYQLSPDPALGRRLAAPSTNGYTNSNNNNNNNNNNGHPVSANGHQSSSTKKQPKSSNRSSVGSIGINGHGEPQQRRRRASPAPVASSHGNNNNNNNNGQQRRSRVEEKSAWADPSIAADFWAGDAASAVGLNGGVAGPSYATSSTNNHHGGGYASPGYSSAVDFAAPQVMIVGGTPQPGRDEKRLGPSGSSNPGGQNRARGRLAALNAHGGAAHLGIRRSASFGELSDANNNGSSSSPPPQHSVTPAPSGISTNC